MVTILALLTLAWTTQAAPTQQKINYPDLKNQLLKSIISQALVQQEVSPSTEDKDKEMAATYCKLLFQVLNSISAKFIDGSVDDFCRGEEIELPEEPRPEDKSSILTETYRRILEGLKGTDLNGNSIGDLING